MNKRENILNIAANLFVEKGFNATSMKDIALKTGIEAASLYNHIQSKQEILSVLLLRIADRFCEGIQSIEKKSITSEAQIKKAIQLHLTIAVKNKELTYLILQDWKHLKEKKKVEFLQKRNLYQEKFKNLLEKAMEDGVVKKGNPEIMRNNILSVLRWTYNQDLYNHPTTFQSTEFEKEILSFIFSGILEKSN